MLFIYAAASAVLLTMGGWLVIQGELSLGQLVAAELIMSAIFYGLPQLAGFLDYFYDVCAAAEELYRFENVDTEVMPEDRQYVGLTGGTLRLHKILCAYGDSENEFSITLPGGSIVQAHAANGSLQQAFCGLLKRQMPVRRGALTLAESDLLTCDIRDLREAIVVFDRHTLLPASIREYLELASTATSASTIHAALELLHLDEEIARLPQGLDTLLAHGGFPLLPEQALRLKLAFALLSPARVLVLSELFDCLPPAVLEPFFRSWCSDPGRILVYFTRRQDLVVFNTTLELASAREQTLALINPK